MGHHTKNNAIMTRLKRASGHLLKVIEMMEKDFDHLGVAQQIQAVESAITNAKKAYIHDHIEHCLADVKDPRKFSQQLEEFKEISKYL